MTAIDIHGRLDSNYLGSVSHGTMRNEDLAPAFLNVLDDAIAAKIIDPAHVGSLNQEWANLLEDDGTVNDDEAATEYVLALFDLLDEMAPEGTYFGAHEGDGADYGFWSYDDGEDEDDSEPENPYAGPGGLLDEFRQAERLIGTY